MLSEAIPFLNGKLFLQLTPFSIFNVQLYIIDLFLIIASFLVFVSNFFHFTEHLHFIPISEYYQHVTCFLNLSALVLHKTYHYRNTNNFQ